MGFGGFLRGIGRIATAAIPGGIDDAIFDAIVGATSGSAPVPLALPPGVPGLPGTGGGCNPPLVRDQSGICVFPGSPGDVSTDSAGSVTVGSGASFVPPIEVGVRTMKCPRFADGKTGILWMNALTGQVVCLPRRANGLAFGLIRKNKPRRKPYISAAQKKSLDSTVAVQRKAKEFATAAGFSCVQGKRTMKGSKKKSSH